MALECRWRVGRRLAAAAGNEPIRLASRVRDAAGRVVVASGPRSRPVPPADEDHALVLPLDVPRQPGAYELDVEPVVEGKFWASTRGLAPWTLRVERERGGALTVDDPRTGQRRRIAWAREGERLRFRLPHARYGAGDTERCVEIPWVLSRYRGERRVLDVGTAHAEARYLAALAELSPPVLVGLDLVGARPAGVRPLVADVRQPALRARSIDLAVAISVLEHVGRDNRRYVGEGADPTDDAGDLAAVRALADLLAPGGRLLLTVPFGVAEDHGWFVQYDAARLDALVEASGLGVVEAEFYRYDDGWTGPVDRARLAECRYGDGAPAASGLACLALS